MAKIGLLDTRDENSKRKFYEVLKELKPDEYVYEIKKNRSIRSLSQNRYYHFILNLICTQSEAGSAYTHDAIHDVCKEKFNYEVIVLPKSGSVLRGRSTSDLDTAEFTTYINKVKVWALDEFGIIVPNPEDVTYKMWMDSENDYSKKFNGF